MNKSDEKMKNFIKKILVLRNLATHEKITLQAQTILRLFSFARLCNLEFRLLWERAKARGFEENNCSIHGMWVYQKPGM